MSREVILAPILHRLSRQSEQVVRNDDFWGRCEMALFGWLERLFGLCHGNLIKKIKKSLHFCFLSDIVPSINLNGGVAQLVRASACHAEGRGFEPLHSRHY